MVIKVIGEGCDKCDQMYENTKEAVAALKLDAAVEKVEDLIEMVKLGVMTTPTLMVDGKVLFAGKAVKTAEIIKALQK